MARSSSEEGPGQEADRKHQLRRQETHYYPATGVRGQQAWKEGARLFLTLYALCIGLFSGSVEQISSEYTF